MLSCDYCLGEVAWNPESVRYEHTTDEERIKNITPGDFVSEPHNRAGTRVMAYDVTDTGTAS